MAEFKLGRIKFVWKGAWNAATTYYVDDVIRYGGKTYICVVGHTANASFYTDLNNIPTKWNQFADGQDWKGNWSGTTLYKLNDIVKYGGQIYICNLSHTSQATLEADQSKWTQFAEGFDWKGAWTTTVTYKLNDIVKYGGNVYICNTAHTSAATDALGLEDDLSSWDLMTEGFDWKTDWSTSTRYKVNDVVKYGGQTYVCSTYHTSAATATLGLEDDQGNWDYFHKGIEFKDTWLNSTRYKVNDLVKYGGSVWRCNTEHTSTSNFDTAKFEIFVGGTEFEQDWSSSTTYQVGDIVRYGGYNYIAKTVHSNQTPSTSTANWDIFAQSFRFVGDYSGATAYKVGQVIRHGGYTYVASADSTGSTPPSANWTRLNSGLRWRGSWLNSTAYLLGDIVSFNQFSYICVAAHTSDNDDSTTTTGDEPNSPEKDSVGNYWNLLTAGLEESVLTTAGDLVYFGAAGVARLPIGEDGQVLTVVNGEPTWATWGVTEQVYYVGPHGVDAPAPTQGLTIDKPWASVRYAAEQIENGLENPQAGYLLKQNRTFLQKEVVEWMEYQVTNAGGVGIWNGYSLDKTKSQRDIGIILDSAIHDLTSSGNVKSLEAASSFFDELGVSVITGDTDQCVAAINYAITLVDRILSNEAPTSNYQTLNGIGAGSRIKQIIDFTYTPEAGTTDRVSTLMSIVSEAIDAGNTNSLPVTVTPGYTIFIKTGIFEEVLPIIVPANTAVVGDELRSSKVSPAGKLIADSDKAKSLTTLAHIRSITDDVIQNIAVTPTTGNTATQDRTSQKAGDLGSSTAISSITANAAEMKDIVTNNTPNAYVLPTPTGGTGNAFTAGYADAARLINANKAFLQDEVSEWILAQIAGNIAPFVGFVYAGTGRAKCERDVGYIVDALRYDLTYGGNLATQIAARSYYSLGVFVETGEQAQALAVQLRIKDIIDNIATGNTAGWTKTTALTQDVSGTAGSAPAATAAQARIQEMYDTINTGTEPTTVAPDITWPAAALLTARTALVAARTEIQSDAIQFIRRRFPTLQFDQALCSRDVGYMVDALGYDMIFGSNFLSIQSGLSYRRGLASTNIVITEQLTAQQDVIDFVGLKSSEIAASGAVAMADLLWSYIIGIVNTGTLPVNTGTNNAITNLDMINGANILRLNKDFLAAEATAYIADTFKTTVSSADGGTDTFTCGSQTWLVAGDTIRFTGTVFGGVALNTTYYVLASGLTATTFKISTSLNGTAVDLSAASGTMVASWYYSAARCENDVRSYIEAIAKDMTYTGNYYSTLAARYYRNALTGSKLEDMYYVRNGCGIRNQTLINLDGSSDGNTTGYYPSALLTANDYGTQRPRAGAYVSLDPGWGPNDDRVWITNKSTYVQNVTTFGIGCTGQKIDGALHAGGNDSIVSNDFTQVLSDGIGAWVTNLGRAELVSVFSYYNYIGYLAENGGKIRATNGNNSYGTYGAIAEGVDPTETPITATVNNRGEEAFIRNVIVSGSEVLLLEYGNAGVEYTSATYTINGAGSGATTVGNETRDSAIFDVRLTDPGDSSGTGGTGYVSASNVAQGGNATTISLAATDTALSTAYVGMGVWIVSGTGAGQYGYINSYNAGNKLATVYKPSTGTAGWDHVVPGTTIASSLDLTTTYEVVPRITFAAPPYTKALRSGLGSLDYKDIVFGDAYGTYVDLPATGGAGSTPGFDVTRRYGVYTVEISAGGFNYEEGDVLTILGTAVGGTTPTNDITITVTRVDPDNGNIITIDYTGTAISQQWVAVASDTGFAYSSPDGITWTQRSMPTSAKWSSVSYGIVGTRGYYVAVARETNATAYSTNGTVWSPATFGTGEEWDWNGVAYGNDRFVAVSESDSSTARRAVSTDGGVTWTVGTIATGAKAITYGQGRFVIVEGNFSNSSAYSADGVTWTTRTLPANNDSSESNWQDIAHGNNRFVAIADNDAQVAVSIDRGVTWLKYQLPEQADWKKVSYGNGVFLAFAEGDIAASSNDGIVWTSRNFQATDIDILNTSKDRFIPWVDGTIASTTWYGLGYGAGTYVALAGTPTPAVAYSTDDGATFTSGTIPAGDSGDARCIAFGGGIWVVPYFSSNDVSTSATGQTFALSSNVLTATRDWCAIAYGGGRFVIIPDSSTTTNFSTNGTSWSAGGALPSAAEWSSIAYGNGIFVAVSGKTADSAAAAYSTDGSSWTSVTLPTSSRWSSIATNGTGRWVAVAGNSGSSTTLAVVSTNNGTSFSNATMPGAAARWTSIVWNGSVFVATAYNGTRSAVSEDGVTWTDVVMASSANWIASAADTTNYRIVAVAFNSNKSHRYVYEANTNLITVVSTAQLAIGDYISIPNDSAGSELFGNLSFETRYYVKTIYDGTRFTVSLTSGGSTRVLTTGSGSMFAQVNKIWSAVAYGNGGNNNGFICVAQNNSSALNVYVGATATGRAYVANNQISEIWIHEPGSNYSTSSLPTMTITDPNNTGAEATFQVRVGNGSLGQPTWTNRGTGYTAASASLVGDGSADVYQTGAFVNFSNISSVPRAGSNLRIAGIDDIYYKIVNIRNLDGVGPYSAQIQISPALGAAESPDHLTETEIRARFSQVRLTGHDFLDIGTGNQANTNYPGLPSTDPIPANETVLLGGGRVFWTSTDQDGNFRVGGLFNVEQATGTATLNAEAFNLAGLNELSLGSVALGGGGATVTEFSTDPFFTADSDSVVPTQRAIKAYISSQIGGGSGSLNVNTITAGSIYIAGSTITSTIPNGTININTTVNFTGGISGFPVVLNLFLQA